MKQQPKKQPQKHFKHEPINPEIKSFLNITEEDVKTERRGRPRRVSMPFSFPHIRLPADVHRAKVKVLELMESNPTEYSTVTQAARKLGINPTQIHTWILNDANFRAAIKMINEVLADANEQYLQSSKNIVAHIFLLKGRRPEFRDNYRVDVQNTKLEELLTQLNKISIEKPIVTVEEPKQEVNILPPEAQRLINSPTDSNVTEE
jgi:hypothetical protein